MVTYQQSILEMENKLKELKRKIKSKLAQRSRLLKKLQDPTYREKLNQQSREYYKTHSKEEIANSTRWNKANKERRNATRRKRYALIKDKINQKRREKRNATRK